jgi:hypothetical protein
MIYSIYDFGGVDPGGNPPSVMVPTGGCNLFIHDYGSGARLQPDPGILVKDFTEITKRNIGIAQQQLTKFLGAPLGFLLPQTLTKAKDLLIGDKRLVAVTSKSPHDYDLTVGSAINIKIIVRKFRNVPLQFVYFRYTGTEHLPEWNALNPPDDSASHASWAVANLNHYFFQQANVKFEVASVSNWDTKDFHTAWTLRDVNQNSIKDLLFPASTIRPGGIRIIVLPSINESDAGAFSGFSSDKTVCYVPFYFAGWRRHNSDADLFIPELAHEIVHALSGISHSQRAKVMCNDHTNSKLDEELLIDYPTINRVNPI